MCGKLGDVAHERELDVSNGKRDEFFLVRCSRWQPTSTPAPYLGSLLPNHALLPIALATSIRCYDPLTDS